MGQVAAKMMQRSGQKARDRARLWVLPLLTPLVTLSLCPKITIPKVFISRDGLGMKHTRVSRKTGKSKETEKHKLVKGKLWALSHSL